MTAQISDVVVYHEKPHSIAGINGTGLFDPAEHGVKPTAPPRWPLGPTDPAKREEIERCFSFKYKW